MFAGASDVAAAVFTRYGRHRGSVLAAGFAFYSLLAIVPSAIALGSIAALLGDANALIEALDRAVQRVPSLQGAAQETVTGLLRVVEQTSSSSFGLTTIVSGLLAVYAASRVFVTVTAILDLAFNRPVRERSWLVRIASTVLTLVLLLVVVLGFVALQALPPVLNAVGAGDGIATALRWSAIPLALAAAFVVFSSAYRWGTPRSVTIGWLNRGGAVAMVIAVIGTVGTTLYIKLSASLGAAIAVLGGAVIVQLWLYVVGIALVSGAEVEAVLIEDQDAAA